MATRACCTSILPVPNAPAAIKGRKCELPPAHKGKHLATCDWCDGLGEEEDEFTDCGVCKGVGVFTWTDEEALDGR